MKKVLIVDDELPLLKIMADQFTQHGIEALTARNGAEGLKSALQNHPDLILLDIKMPVMDGISMMEKLRQDKWGNNAAVMVLTNWVDSDSINATMNNKAINYYVKADWKLEDLVRGVEEKLPIIENVSQANINNV